MTKQLASHLSAAASLALFTLGCGAELAPEPSDSFLSYSRLEWDAQLGRARVDVQNTSRARLAVMGCAGFESQRTDGSWTSVPLVQEQACVWPVYLVAPDSTIAFEFPVASLSTGCNYRLQLQVARPGEQGSERVHEGDLTFENVLSPTLCF